MDVFAAICYVLLLSFTAYLLLSTRWHMSYLSVPKPNFPTTRAKVFMRLGV